MVRLHAVGMQHRGGKGLQIGGHYQVYPEFYNQFDNNALAIKSVGGEQQNAQAYLRRDEAKCLAKLFREGLVLSSGLLLKPKEPPVKDKYRGLQQVVNVGFFAKDGALSAIETVLQPLMAHCKILSK